MPKTRAIHCVKMKIFVTVQAQNMRSWVPRILNHLRSTPHLKYTKIISSIKNFRLLWAGGGWATQTRRHKCSFCDINWVSLFEILERLRSTFTPSSLTPVLSLRILLDSIVSAYFLFWEILNLNLTFAVNVNLNLCITAKAWKSIASRVSFTLVLSR